MTRHAAGAVALAGKVQESRGAYSGSTAWLVAFQRMEALAGPEFVPVVLGTAAVPLVQVKLSQGRFEDMPSVLVNVITFAPEFQEVMSLDAYTMSEREEEPASRAACTASVTSHVIHAALTDVCRST